MNKLIGVIAISAVFVTGCATQDSGFDTQSEQDAAAAQQGDSMQQPQPIVGSDTEASALRDDMLSAQELLEEADSPLASRVIYFAYDSAKIDDASLGMLEAHGNFIAGNGNVSLRLEGHADERGSREYNIGLGDRRAQSVRRILLFQGASSDQIETISYGEEQPAMLGHDESAWSQNRRVELIYQVN